MANDVASSWRTTGSIDILALILSELAMIRSLNIPRSTCDRCTHLDISVLDEAKVKLDGKQLHSRDVYVSLFIQQIAPARSSPCRRYRASAATLCARRHGVLLTVSTAGVLALHAPMRAYYERSSPHAITAGGGGIAQLGAQTRGR